MRCGPSLTPRMMRSRLILDGGRSGWCGFPSPPQRRGAGDLERPGADTRDIRRIRGAGERRRPLHLRGFHNRAVATRARPPLTARDAPARGVSPTCASGFDTKGTVRNSVRSLRRHLAHHVATPVLFHFTCGFLTGHSVGEEARPVAASPPDEMLVPRNSGHTDAAAGPRCECRAPIRVVVARHTTVRFLALLLDGRRTASWPGDTRSSCPSRAQRPRRLVDRCLRASSGCPAPATASAKPAVLA